MSAQPLLLPSFATPQPPAVHLVLQGLLWPETALRDLVFDLKLPALAHLLGTGQYQHFPLNCTDAWIAHILQTDALPAAALRMSAQQGSPPPHLLCLDPVHLRLEKTQLILEDPARLELTIDEAHALAEAVRPLLTELGSLHVTQAGEWHLARHETIPMQTTALRDAIGKNADALVPTGAQARIWRRVLNEVQMTLHTHPINNVRSARGLPTINSLWAWGEGEHPNATIKVPFQLVQSNDTVLKGFALHHNLEWQALPTGFNSEVIKKNGQPQTTLIHIDTLANATQVRDAMTWRTALQAIETDWFAPLLAALKTGQLRELTLHGSGNQYGFMLECRRADRWRFWRKPAALTVLGTP